MRARLPVLVLLPLLPLLGCGTDDDTGVGSGSDDVAHTAPEIWVEPGTTTVGAKGLPASAPDGTVAVLTTTATAVGARYTLELRSAEDYGLPMPA